MSDLRKLEAKAREIAQRISATLPPGVGFVLMLHDFGPNGWATFVSSGQREDTVAMLAETLGNLAPESSPERRELAGRTLHRVMTDCDDPWGQMYDAEKDQWRDSADELLRALTPKGASTP